MTFSENQLVHIATTIMSMVNKHTDYLGMDIFENNSILFSPSNRSHYYSIRLHKKGMIATVKEYIDQKRTQEVTFRVTFTQIEEIYIVNSFWVWGTTEKHKLLDHFVELTALTKSLMAK